MFRQHRFPDVFFNLFSYGSLSTPALSPGCILWVPFYPYVVRLMCPMGQTARGAPALHRGGASARCRQGQQQLRRLLPAHHCGEPSSAFSFGINLGFGLWLQPLALVRPRLRPLVSASGTDSPSASASGFGLWLVATSPSKRGLINVI